jgi:hypothetical protein
MARMAAPTTEAIVRQAGELARNGDLDGAANQLVATVGRDRQSVEAARDQVAAHLHRHVDDWQATATLTLLNRALANLPRNDPLDWRVRWARHRKP